MHYFKLFLAIWASLSVLSFLHSQENNDFPQAFVEAISYSLAILGCMAVIGGIVFGIVSLWIWALQ